MIRKFFYILLILFLTLSCQKKKKFNDRYFDLFNNRIIQGEKDGAEWVKSPLKIAIRLTFADEFSELTNIVYKQSDQNQMVEVIIEKNWPPLHDHDDSKSKYHIFLKNIDGKWRVSKK